LQEGFEPLPALEEAQPLQVLLEALELGGFHGAASARRADSAPSTRAGDRSEALGPRVGRGLPTSCHIADAWINEVKWLGITISPSYVGEPECNGVIERFMRTLKEQCLHLHRFQTLEEARRVIAEFIDRYNYE
jgi:putative transposase